MPLRLLCENRMANRKRGSQKHREAALYAKKIPNLLIENALNEINEEEYHAVLYRVLSTKHRALKRDAMAREKLIRFCLQRGFTYDEIESTLRKFTN